MALRHDLCAPELDRGVVAEALQLAIEIEDLLAEASADVGVALEAFNAVTGGSATIAQFAAYPEVMSREDFVRSRMAVLPRVPRLERSELLELAALLFDEEELADWEMNYYLRLFAAHVDHDDVLDLLETAETPGELVDLARWT